MQSAVGLLKYALIGLAALAMASAGHAQSPRLFVPGKIEFTVPDKWVAEARGQKMTVVGPTEDAFIVFLMLKQVEGAELRIEIGKVLASQLDDVVLPDEGQSLTVDGTKALALRGSGASDAVSIAFRAMVLMPKGRAPVMVLAYTTPANFPATDPTFVAVFDSLKVK